MSRPSYLFTSESVSEGHPDKVCDRISDEVVDAFYLAGAREGLDPWTIRAACETLATTNRVVVAGEYRGPASIDAASVEHVVRQAIRDIGYEQDGFHWDNAKVEVLLHPQSADIAQGVDASGNKDEGAGDQGIMFGYACTETPELMPAPIHYAHKILRLLTDARKSGEASALGPDAKSQVTVAYRDGRPVGVTQIVVSTQHLDETLTSEEVRTIVEPYVRKALPEGWIGRDTIWHVNPTGKFVIGGPDGDCGLTGRKIIVDTYGGAAPHGGGAFSGKDPTKVDRSAAYAARYLAKNVVKAGLADRCTIQLSYAIGVAKPLSIYADLGNGHVDPDKLEAALMEIMDLSPRGIRSSSGPQQADLRAHLRLRPFRARARQRRRLLLGEDGPGRRTALGPVLSAAPAAAMGGGPAEAGAFFGRRKGKRLRSAQDERIRRLLPRLRIADEASNETGSPSPWSLDPLTLFRPGVEEVRLEIGFGGGEHLARAAGARPSAGFIGCEVFLNGIAKLLAEIDAAALDNVRLWDRDAVELLRGLPQASIAGIDLLYPDPWPKRRQRKRRFLSDDTLATLARVMRPGAELRFATDIDDYAGWAIARVLRSPLFVWPAARADDWRLPWPGWPGTRYEAKARREGRASAYLTFVRRAD